MWDIEVDVACVGAGIGSLASAVASVDAGARVLVATPPPPCEKAPFAVALRQRVGGFLGSWQRADLDNPTAEYLTALSQDLDPKAEPGDARVTVRSVQALSADKGSVEPFVGANLKTWNAQCLASPFGLLHSSVSGRRATRMRASDGQTLEVRSIGSLRPADLDPARGLSQWMVNQARDRDVDVREASRLDRIVFDDGRVVGVVLSSPEGPLAVRVRHGLTIAGAAPTMAADIAFGATPDEFQVCIVGKSANRFHRVELLATVAAREPVRPLCHASGMRLRAPLWEPRTLRSDAGNCGKLR